MPIIVSEALGDVYTGGGKRRENKPNRFRDRVEDALGDESPSALGYQRAIFLDSMQQGRLLVKSVGDILISVFVGRRVAVVALLGIGGEIQTKVILAVRPRLRKVVRRSLRRIRAAILALGLRSWTRRGRLANDSRGQDVQRVHLPTRPTGDRGTGDLDTEIVSESSNHRVWSIRRFAGSRVSQGKGRGIARRRKLGS